jgi:DNA-binding beta-propeller fold protein YncE
VQAVVCDKAGNLFVTDTFNNTVRKIVIGTQVVTTVVGSPDRMGVVLGPLPAGLGNPFGLALGLGGELLIADSAENAILAAQLSAAPSR